MICTRPRVRCVKNDENRLTGPKPTLKNVVELIPPKASRLIKIFQWALTTTVGAYIYCLLIKTTSFLGFFG